jgi:hypothetical protein
VHRAPGHIGLHARFLALDRAAALVDLNTATSCSNKALAAPRSSGRSLRVSTSLPYISRSWAGFSRAKRNVLLTDAPSTLL